MSLASTDTLTSQLQAELGCLKRAKRNDDIPSFNLHRSAVSKLLINISQVALEGNGQATARVASQLVPLVEFTDQCAVQKVLLLLVSSLVAQAPPDFHHIVCTPRAAKTFLQVVYDRISPHGIYTRKFLKRHPPSIARELDALCLPGVVLISRQLPQLQAWREERKMEGTLLQLRHSSRFRRLMCLPVNDPMIVLRWDGCRFDRGALLRITGVPTINALLQMLMCSTPELTFGCGTWAMDWQQGVAMGDHAIPWDIPQYERMRILVLCAGPAPSESAAVCVGSSVTLQGASTPASVERDGPALDGDELQQWEAALLKNTRF